MFTTGFKYWFAAGLVALGAAFGLAVSTSDAGLMDTVVGPLTFGYKGAVGDHAGYAVLAGFGGLSIAVAILLAVWRDADPRSVAEVARTEVPPAPIVPQSASPWPAVGAFAAALISLGVVVDPAFTAIGVALIVVAGLEWAITTWAERVTVDADENRVVRTKLLFPVELPIIAAASIGVIVLAGSRIFLAVDATAAVVIAGVLATVIFGGGIAIAAKPDLSRNLVNVVLVVGGLGLLAGGVIAAAAGERDFHHPAAEHGDDHGDEPVDPDAEHSDEPAEDDHADEPGEGDGEHDDEALVVLP